MLLDASEAWPPITVVAHDAVTGVDLKTVRSEVEERSARVIDL